MLSTETPPPDLPCSSSHQVKSICDDIQIDLLESGPDDDDNPLPKFCIRDYVFNTRGENIKNHWPFSSKNLKLCLKNGVKDVLPPFEAHESVKKASIVGRAAEKSDDDVVKKLALSGSEECPSTTTSLSFSENLVEKAQVPIKKCRLVVKLKTNEELLSVSETMASSNVCPVCKTFSSPSNTTLNAHIDQCLSGESATKWTPNDSKAIKHRIKPRKTRMMVDIYTTAKCCTLEDLDRRNGTNWAGNLGSLPPVEGNNSEDNKGDEEAAVYFDSNGTKLRILSKFNDDFTTRDVVKRDRESKTLTMKKKYLLRCSPRPEVNNGQGREFTPEEDDERDQAQTRKTNDETRRNDFGVIKQWVGSKRTGLKKKTNVVRANTFVNPLLSTESSSHDEDTEQEQPYLRKKTKFSLKQSKRDRLSVDMEDYALNKKARRTSPALDAADATILSGCNKLSSSRNKFQRKRLEFKKARREYVSGSEDNQVESFVPREESLDSGFEALAGPSDVEFVKQHYMESYQEYPPADVEQDGDLDHMAANEGQGNYFVDVDPIPIPGPPGSFLPSPGRMGSEELEANSSLTTTRILPFEDRNAGSPISATSHEPHRDISDVFVPFEHAHGKSEVDQMSSPDRFKNCQPCCCSRKEGVQRRITTCRPPQETQWDHHRRRRHVPEPEKVDCESPSASNPILRLMGKNLMVMNNQENLTPQSTTLHDPFRFSSQSKIRMETTPPVETVQTPVKHREVIIIDDSPEIESVPAVRTSRMVPLGYDSSNRNPFYSYQTRCYPLYNGPEMVHTQAPGMDESRVKWNRIPEVSQHQLHPNSTSLTASSPSTAQLRSTFYFSPGFSLPTNFT